MAENEMIVENNESEVLKAQNAPEAKPTIWAKVKEWFRKQTVALKRAPQRIPLLLLLIVSVYFLIILFTLSQAVNECPEHEKTKTTGICIFVTTLLSILVMVSFLNAFPKRKKVNWFFVGLVAAMLAAMVVCDIMCYIQFGDFLDVMGADAHRENFDPIWDSKTLLIVHVVLLGVFGAVFACLPLIKIGLNKIDTSIAVESATSNMKEEIDMEE